ncbi:MULTISPECIES: thiamine pyrophosphate-binding protein [Pseudomonas]|uniref:Thiamine pyrophosphate-binding protein n=1 Tax=Pseudomonas taiwanensis TaxID=470150 RepID=A0A7L9GAT3_9PSED|nr:MULTISPECIES: thiamine pyrophosphate-binding protein [Pseudomonas]MDD2146702.1 thiamine pyrophosphate-binding protein [Pseudomonas putida]QOJ89501.1 thiamine pyrophosphate-binding protein [Pseudomonas taiwanensis]WQQ35138.1 thiamine pyrophosphate-binding protein [Pseudomonas putida]HDS1705650.1 thiamine pyrophosphate-binding protein [Pseudomonas putida]
MTNTCQKTITGGDALVRMLQLQGVKHIFGVTGDTSLPFYDALYRLDHGITHVLARDERCASYMAYVYAKLTGKVGVCEGPSGAGATYMLPGIAEANGSSVCVLGINSDIPVAGRDKFVLTELDMKALFKPVTKWNSVIETPARLPKVLRTAFLEMTSGAPGAAHIAVPYDVMKGELDESEVYAFEQFNQFPSIRPAADPEIVKATVKAIRDSKRPVFVCAGGVILSGGCDELQKLSAYLDVAIATSISGQGAVSDDNPLAVGVVGTNGSTPEARAFMQTCDLVIFLGTRAGSVVTEKWGNPKIGDRQIGHIDIDSHVIGCNYNTQFPLLGDARTVLQQLLEVAQMDNAVDRPDMIDAIATVKSARSSALNRPINSKSGQIEPEVVVKALQASLPEDAVLVIDPGTPTPFLSAYLDVTKPGNNIVYNRFHGGLGYSLPGVVGAYYARPDQKCVAIMGDGSFGFSSSELETIFRLNIPVTLVVLSNSNYGWIKAGQFASYGERYFSVDFSNTSSARIAEAHGIKAWRVQEDEDVQTAIREALAHSGPSLVEITVRELHETQAPVSAWMG